VAPPVNRRPPPPRLHRPVRNPLISRRRRQWRRRRLRAPRRESRAPLPARIERRKRENRRRAGSLEPTVVGVEGLVADAARVAAVSIRT
jgi:hypothetical protein